MREAQLAQYNYILVVGEAEAAAGTVNVRTRDNVVHGMFAAADVVEILKEEKGARALASIFGDKKGLRVGGGEGEEDGAAAAAADGVAAAAADGAAN